MAGATAAMTKATESKKLERMLRMDRYNRQGRLVKINQAVNGEQCGNKVIKAEEEKNVRRGRTWNRCTDLLSSTCEPNEQRETGETGV